MRRIAYYYELKQYPHCPVPLPSSPATQQHVVSLDLWREDSALSRLGCGSSGGLFSVFSPLTDHFDSSRYLIAGEELHRVEFTTASCNHDQREHRMLAVLQCNILRSHVYRFRSNPVNSIAWTSAKISCSTLMIGAISRPSIAKAAFVSSAVPSTTARAMSHQRSEVTSRPP